MKTKILFFVLLIANYFNANSQINYSLTFNAGNFQISNDTIANNIYSKVNYTDLYNTGNVGEPYLPVKILKFIIPANMDLDNINVSSSSFQEINLSHKIVPTQNDIPISLNYSLPDIVDPDSIIYNSNNPFPGNIAYHINTGFFDAVNKIITISVYPAQYIPGSYKINFYTNISFTINLKTNSTYQNNFSIYRNHKNKIFYNNILKSIVNNPQDIPLYTDSAIFKTTKSPNTTLPFYEYVIITDNSLKTAFDDFVKWKKRKGIDIGVVTTQEIYNDPSIMGDEVISGGNGIYDNAGKVRQYLYEAYQNGTVWTLLGGDPTYVPMRIGNGSNNSADLGNNIPTDLYFADFNGNWNVDGDLFYGEQTQDHADYIAEIFVGRLLCSSSQQILNWSNNVLKYEQNPGNGNHSYLLRSFSIQADQLQQGNQAGYVASYLPMYTSTIWGEFPSPNALFDNTGIVTTPGPYFGQMGSPKGANVIAEMNNHYVSSFTTLLM